MPAAATLVNSASTLAFTAPQGALGFILWNTSAAALRIGLAGGAAASGATEGIPLPAGSATEPKYFTHYFAARLLNPLSINIYQASGGDITSGVGYAIIHH